jgi:hypothetical protein
VRLFEHPVPADIWSELRAEGLLGPEVPCPRRLSGGLDGLHATPWAGGLSPR